MENLTKFIESELNLSSKRALCVKMYKLGLKVSQIQEILAISQPSANKWIRLYNAEGIESLRPKYKGTVGFLSKEQRAELTAYISEKTHYSLEELQKYVEEKYDVVYKSLQSYYDILSAGGLSWHRTHKENPKKDEAAVAERREEIKKSRNRKKKR